MTVIKCNVCGKKMQGHDNKCQQFKVFPLKKAGRYEQELYAEMEIVFKVLRLRFNMSHDIETDICAVCRTKYLKQIFNDFKE